MKRRAFITLLGGAAVAWPLAARAQHVERIRRVGVLLSIAETDPDAQRRIQAFQQGLDELGWTEGRNIRVEYRFGAGDSDRIAKEVTDLVALKPDVIVGNSTPVVVALRQTTRSIPVVFVQIIDPVGSGLVETRYAELGSSVPKGADRGPAGLQKLVESEVARITPIIKAAGVIAN
jgi:putative tryptophan/tyrosine transport system substrate-binding protein